MHKFSPSQQLFAVVAIVIFLALLVLAYRRDMKIHRRYYKGVGIVLLSIVILIFLLYVIKVVFYSRTA